MDVLPLFVAFEDPIPPPPSLFWLTHDGFYRSITVPVYNSNYINDIELPNEGSEAKKCNRIEGRSTTGQRQLTAEKGERRFQTSREGDENYRFDL